MPYWIARLLGRADGPKLATCGNCRTVFPKEQGHRATGTPDLMCSEACAVEATENFAW